MREIYAGRRDALRRDMRRRGLDVLLISRDANRFYLSGFELHDTQYNESSGRLVITGDGRDWLATDSRYAEAAARLWEPERVFVYKDDAGDIASLLRRCGSIIGIEARGVSLAFARALGGAGGLFLQAADGLVERLRSIKGPEEVAALSASFALNHKMLGWLERDLSAGRLAPGLRETDLAWRIERFFRENGASELAFPVIAAAGRNAALPHAIPGSGRLEAETPLLIDAGCRVDDYCSDQTRTFWMGEKFGPAHSRFVRIYKLVREAQRAALAVMRPGVTGKEAFAAARAVFEKAGEAQAFTHGLGHGVGLETHEAPSLNFRNEHPLEAGMVVTVEPGLYYPGWGGARLEYTVLVEEDGVRIL
ncbi:MAG: aminopeptidase P family protein [Desulfovibrio sp.]|nr:aminopeptidase P family protein [Desulfovibrio sp.]